jgi:hypothetical protein
MSSSARVSLKTSPVDAIGMRRTIAYRSLVF